MKKINTALAAVAAAAALGMLAPGMAHAGECALVPKDSTGVESYEPSRLLDTGKFAQVDAALEKLHKKNLSSDGGDLLTLRTMNDLLAGRQENLVRMWADERPQSFFAQLAAGIFYSDRAANARGNRTISQTSKDQLRQMSALDDKSMVYLKKAMQLDPRSALPHGMMLVIAGQEGQADGKTAEQWLQAANQVDPKNMMARIQAVRYFSPRWGGSYELLDQMVQQAAKSLSAQSAHYLEYNVVLAKASHEEVIAKNKSKAHELYKRAKGMCENSETAQEGLVRTYQ